MAQRPDYDSAWKDALAAYFPEFMRMLRPGTHARIDWAHPPKFLDKEFLRLEWWRSRTAELRENAPRNPFAVIILAQLEATALHHASDRLAGKIELVRSLAQWGFQRDNRRHLFRVIDAMLHLPDELELAFEAAVIQIEKEQQVSYVTSIERVRLRRERAQGLEEGVQKGAAELLTTLITGKFGSLPDWASARMAEADEATLKQWALRILKAHRIEDVFV